MEQNISAGIICSSVDGTNVKVLTVNPGATKTEFFVVAGANPAGPLAPVSDVVDATSHLDADLTLIQSKTSSSSKFKVKPKVRRRGVVAKTKASKLKSSKNYLKKSRGQG